MKKLIFRCVAVLLVLIILIPNVFMASAITELEIIVQNAKPNTDKIFAASEALADAQVTGELLYEAHKALLALKEENATHEKPEDYVIFSWFVRLNTLSEDSDFTTGWDYEKWKQRASEIAIDLTNSFPNNLPVQNKSYGGHLLWQLANDSLTDEAWARLRWQIAAASGIFGVTEYGRDKYNNLLKVELLNEAQYDALAILLNETMNNVSTYPASGETMKAIIDSLGQAVTDYLKKLENGEPFALSVINGSGSNNSVYAGTQVSIIADAPASGYAFYCWDDDSNSSFVDKYSSQTLYTMPYRDAIVQAYYKPIYELTVSNGSGGGFYFEGEEVEVVANPADDGYHFVNWTGDTGVITVGTATDMTIKVTIPARAVNLTATYELNPIMPSPTPTPSPSPTPTPKPIVPIIPVRPMATPAPDTRTLPEILAEDYFAPMGLFIGTGSGFSLDKPLTRIQALIITLRFLGLEDETKAFAGGNPFIDVTAEREYYDRYAAFAYAKGLANGVDAEHTLFKPDREVTYQEFVTFLLRTLNFSDITGGFEYKDAIEFAENKGLFDLEYDYGSKQLLRGDAVVLMANTLTTKMKNSEKTLLDVLVERGVVTKVYADKLRAFLKDYK